MGAARRSLPFNEWPLSDQKLWRSAVAEGDILDGAGPGAHWRQTTKDNTRKAYGYWLYWLAANGALDDTHHPLAAGHTEGLAATPSVFPALMKGTISLETRRVIF